MRKWAWIVVVVVSLGLGYAVAAKAWVLPGVQTGGGQNTTEIDSELICSLGQFVTNLRDSGRYVRITVDLQAMDRKSQEELTARASELRTDIYALLRSKHYEDLEGEEGLRNLQKAVLERIDAKCPGAVRAVFFTEFLIQ